MAMNALLAPESLALPKRKADEIFSLHASSVGDPKVRKFKQLLISWMNSYLREDKIYVRDINEDLHDGQLLLLFLEKLTKLDLNSHVGAIAERSKRENLNIVVRFCKERLGFIVEEGLIDGIVEKDFVSISRLLVMLAHYFKCPYQLPSNIEVVIVHREPMKTGGSASKTSRHQITGDETSFGTPESELVDQVQNLGVSISPATIEVAGVTRAKDAFDDLFEPDATEKLEAVKKLLLAFVNKHLTQSGVQVSNIANQFHNGVYLIILIGSLGNFFVPLYNYHIAPTTTDMKMHNVNFAFRLMTSLEIPRGPWFAEDVVKQDVRTTMRILYSLFGAFKNAPA